MDRGAVTAPTADVRKARGAHVNPGTAQCRAGSHSPRTLMPPLCRNEQGISYGDYPNLSAILRYDKRLKIFRWNELSDACFIVGTPPWSEDRRPIDRLFGDFDAYHLKCWLTDHGSHGSGHRIADPEEKVIREAIRDVSKKNKYHPVREWLSGLRWDGIPRVENFCSEAFGVDNSPTYKAASKILLYGPTARALFPGCEFNYFPVLSGRQGHLKSALLKELFSPWYGELSSKDLDVETQVRGKWVAEDVELVCMNRFGGAFFEAWFLDGSYDYRRVGVKRDYVIVGTTNGPLKANDGEFRASPHVLPIDCGNRGVNLYYAATHREQLFAEAKEAVAAVGEGDIGSMWIGLDEELAWEIEITQGAARAKSSVEEIIVTFLRGAGVRGGTRLTIREIISGCIKAHFRNGFPLLDYGDFDGIGEVLKNEGYALELGADASLMRLREDLVCDQPGQDLRGDPKAPQILRRNDFVSESNR